MRGYIDFLFRDDIYMSKCSILDLKMFSNMVSLPRGDYSRRRTIYRGENRTRASERGLVVATTAPDLRSVYKCAATSGAHREPLPAGNR